MAIAARFLRRLAGLPAKNFVRAPYAKFYRYDTAQAVVLSLTRTKARDLTSTTNGVVYRRKSPKIVAQIKLSIQIVHVKHLKCNPCGGWFLAIFHVKIFTA